MSVQRLVADLVDQFAEECSIDHAFDRAIEQTPEPLSASLTQRFYSVGVRLRQFSFYYFRQPIPQLFRDFDPKTVSALSLVVIRPFHACLPVERTGTPKSTPKYPKKYPEK